MRDRSGSSSPNAAADLRASLGLTGTQLESLRTLLDVVSRSDAPESGAGAGGVVIDLNGDVRRRPGSRTTPRSRSTFKHLEPAGSKHLEPAGSKHLEPAGSKHLEPAGSKHLEPAGSKHLEPAGSKHVEEALSKLVSALQGALHTSTSVGSGSVKVSLQGAYLVFPITIEETRD